MDEHEQIINEKLSHYASKELVVHITCTEGRFYNGVIVDVNDVRIIFLDERLGEMYISLKEIKDVEPREEKR